MTTRSQALDAEISLRRVDEEATSVLSQVAERTVRGEFRAAPDLQVRLPKGDRPRWIGHLIEVPSDGVPIERSIVLTEKRYEAIRRFLMSRGMPAITQMDGRDVALGVGLAIGTSGSVDLDLRRVLDIGDTGPWSRWVSAQKDLVKIPPAAAGTNTARRSQRLQLDRAPRRIVVIAPQKGSAGRTDVERELGPHSILTKKVSVTFTEASFVGFGADGHIARAISEAAPGADLILVARGGGKQTDLWPFETAVVAKAIQTASTQHGAHVVTALGHDRDISLADQVADSSFPVPHTAAQHIRTECWKMLDRSSTTKRTSTSRPQATPVRDKTVAAATAARIARLEQRVTEMSTARDQLRQQLDAATRDHELSMLTVLASTVPTPRHAAALKDMRRAVDLRWAAMVTGVLAGICLVLAGTGLTSEPSAAWGFAAGLLALGGIAAGVTSRKFRRRALQEVALEPLASA